MASSNRSRGRPTIVAMVALAVWCMGCSETSLPGHDPTVWSMEDRPELELGSVEGADGDGFFRVRDVKVLSAGGVLVANGGSQELRLYSPDGTLESTLGGSGEGPGEFRGISWMMALDDSAVVAFDPVLMRLTRFSLEGGETSTWSIAASDSLEWQTAVGPFPDRALLISGIMPRSPSSLSQSGRVRPPMAFAEYDWTGEPRRTLIGDVPGTEFYQGESDAGRVQTSAVLPRVTVAAAGSSFLAVGWNDGPSIQVVDRSDGEVRTVHWDQAAVPVENRHVEHVIQEMVDQAGGGDGGRQLRRVLEPMDVPEALPWYDQMLVSDQDEIWIREYPGPGANEGRWRVLDPDGTLLAEMTVPARFDIMDVAGDRLAGVWRDALGVETVRVSRFSR